MSAMTTFRVFSGFDSRQAEAAEVFAYSVRENASTAIDVAFLKLEGGSLFAPSPEGIVFNFNRRGRTDFSYSRFMVPHLCAFQGRALFADGCDMLCLGDVAELAAFDMQGKPIAVVKHQAPAHLMRGRRARSWSSLMLMDCAALKNRLTPERAERWPDSDLMRLTFLADHEIADLPKCWNSLIEPTNINVTTKTDAEPNYVEGYEPTALMKIAHWSYLSDPNGNSWIDRSGSAVWAEWRERWRGSLATAAD